MVRSTGNLSSLVKTLNGIFSTECVHTKLYVTPGGSKLRSKHPVYIIYFLPCHIEVLCQSVMRIHSFAFNITITISKLCVSTAIRSSYGCA